MNTPTRKIFQATDPATGARGPLHEGHDASDVQRIVAATRSAFLAWRRTSFDERAVPMRNAAAVLRRRRRELADLMREEMGKPVTDGLAEVEKCATACDHYADHAARYLAPEPVDIDAKSRAYVTYNPLGVVLAVMPWNFPLWQVFRFAAPTLMAGNAAVLKHASNVPGSALAIESVLREAGFPADLFRTLLIGSDAVGDLIADDRIAAVTLTGSVPAGRKVAERAGAALKPCVLELGGADAYIVLEDANIPAAAQVAAAARLVNGGQSCIAGKRFIAVAPVRAAFEQALVEAMRGHAMGDPADPATKLGPLQSVAARDEVHAQVQASVANGARLLLGGTVPDRPGAWYPPTVLSGVVAGQPAHDDEVFGPVAAVIEAADEADAIRIANDSEFGLGSAVLTGDVARGERIAATELEAGMAFVNDNVRSDPRLPFGGVKHSGVGRECAGYGIKAFVNVKTVQVKR